MMIDNEMAALRARFSRRAKSEIAGLRIQLRGGNIAIPELETIAHRLAGTAALLAFEDVARAAAVVDARFATGDPPTAEEVELLLRSVELLTLDEQRSD